MDRMSRVGTGGQVLMEKRGFGVMEGVFQRYRDGVRQRQRNRFSKNKKMTNVNKHMKEQKIKDIKKRFFLK